MKYFYKARIFNHQGTWFIMEKINSHCYLMPLCTGIKLNFDQIMKNRNEFHKSIPEKDWVKLSKKAYESFNDIWTETVEGIDLSTGEKFEIKGVKKGNETIFDPALLNLKEIHY